MRKPVVLLTAAAVILSAATLTHAARLGWRFGPARPATSAVLTPGEAVRPKFGSGAVPIVQARDYLRGHDAPDFWALMPYYVPQATQSSCSLASTVMILNALRGLPALAKDALITEASLLEALPSPDWARSTGADGEGVSFAEFQAYLGQSLQAYGLGNARLEVFRPDAATPEALAQLRRLLSENEASASDLIVAVFDQGVLTGDTDVGHISPIGAYDAEHHRVLVMDVDRKWYVPYWVSDEALLAALVHTPAEDSEPGGLVRIVKDGGNQVSLGERAAGPGADGDSGAPSAMP